MYDVLNKVFSIFLAFLALVLAPLTFSTLCSDMVTSREVLNDTSRFIDMVTDKGYVTQDDLDDFYLSINSHGGVYSAEVVHYQLIEEPMPGGTTKVLYVANSGISDLEQGLVASVTLNTKDCVKVHVQAVAYTFGERLLYTVLRIDKGSQDFYLAGTVG